MILDDIKEKFRLTNSYEDWKEYRQYLTDIVIGCGKKKRSKSVAVIGAGRCNDIDLKALCRYFETVTLIDIDTGAVDEAVARLAVDEANRVEFKEISLTGVNETDINLYFERVLAAVRCQGYKLTLDHFEKIVLSELDIIKHKLLTSDEVLTEAISKRDIVLCNGVFSQLFSTVSFFARSLAGSIPGSLFDGAVQTADRLEQELIGINNALIPVICKALLNVANDFSVFGNEYLTDAPVEGARQCIEAVRGSGRDADEFEIPWNFNHMEKVTYNMLIQVVEGNSILSRHGK